MANARNIIDGSLRLLGVLASGESSSAAEAEDCLDSLNVLLDSWSTESLTVMGMVQYEFDIQEAKQFYTVGDGGDMDMKPPKQLVDMSLIYQSGQDVFLSMDEYTLDQYAAITLTSYQTPIPQGFFYNATFPMSQLYIYPYPQAGTRLRFFAQQDLEQIPTVSAPIVLSTGYERALRYNLAIELAPEYGKEPSAAVVKNAAESKENIQRLNVQDITLSCDPAVMNYRGGFNRITGGYN